MVYCLLFWGLLVTLALAAVYAILVGIVYAVANLNSNKLAVLCEALETACAIYFQGKQFLRID